MLPNTVRLKVVVVGDEGVGKARMLTTYISNSIPEYVPVQSDNDNITVRIGENKTIVLFLCDTSGQQDYDRLRPLSYPGTDIFLVLFSIHNKESFENLRTKWIPEVKHHCSNAHLILIGTNNSSNDDIERQVSDEEINEIQENYGILIYKYCNLFDLESVKSTFKKIVNICAEQVSLTFRLKNFKISTTKTEEILKFVEINNYNDLIKICGEYDKVKYSKLKLFSKSYKDIYLAYEIIIKFFTMHAIKICSNNCLDTNNYSIKINSNESAVIYFNILLNILKEFYNKFGGNKFEINQNILSKFIIDKITKYQNLMKQIFQESFEVELLDYLINDQSYERLPSFIEIKKKKQNDESENSIIDLFEKPYMFNDRYVIIELLGEGGYGIVFKAFDIEKYVWVALKVVTTFESLNGFEREIDVVTKLGKHLNIIEYLDYGYFQFNNTSIPFIVMELCDYSLNDKLLDNNNEFILIDKLSIFQQMCEGVEHLHSNNIIHRDIKLDNILIKKIQNKELKTKNEEQVKIVDFGTAKQQKKKGTMTINIGTWNYMAPELFYEDRDLMESINKDQQLSTIDNSLDIYALGCCLFLLLTKKNLEYKYCKFYEMLKEEKGEKKLHNYLCEAINLMLQDERDKNRVEILQRLLISIIQRNPLKRPKISIIVDIIKNIRTENIKLTEEQNEALLQLRDFNEEIINEKDKMIKNLQSQLIEQECYFKNLLEEKEQQLIALQNELNNLKQ
ncbi:hypothetical protein ABK040_001899 [Willaertia magna]